MPTDEKPFHAELHTVRGRFKPEQLNNLAFLFSALSPVRTSEQLFNDADIEACDWTHVFSLASNGLVAPLLFARLQQKQLTQHCPEDFVIALEAFHEANCKRNDRHREILFETIALLNQVDITPTLLKGAHALVGKMPDYNERVIGDIDLLIPIEQVKTAHTTLRKAGFYHDELAFNKKEDRNHDPSEHQLEELFHSSGSGYVELHRFPNYSEQYPSLIKTCFQPDNMLETEEERCRFYYNHPWQLLLYNQVHHYHSAILRWKRLDIRHLSEQSSLIKEINNPDFLQQQVKTVFQNKASASHMQFALLATLFGQDLPKNVLMMDSKHHRYYRETLSTLQGSLFPVYKENALSFAKQITQLAKPSKLRKRIFNLSWYRSRPKAFRKMFNIQ